MTVSVTDTRAPLDPTEFGPNLWLVDEMYRQFLDDPDSVSEAWQEFFEDYKPHSAELKGTVATPDRTGDTPHANDETPDARRQTPEPETRPIEPQGSNLKAQLSLRGLSLRLETCRLRVQRPVPSATA